ncbi:MAG: hypothetical protein IAI50_07185 [Candidatus Eremiobacteraeota bacterium]|nr:hypothetical protein [Candidatus Eremiobacteraeota bacterium]
MIPAPQSGLIDELERTTLRIDASISALSSSQLQHALQSIPGVLVATIDAANARAIVAHDPAVSTATLVAAASGVGVRSTIVRQKPARAAGTGVAPSAGRVLSGRFLLLVVAPLFALMCVEAMVPNFAKSRLVTPILLSFIWAFIAARAMSDYITTRRGRR